MSVTPHIASLEEIIPEVICSRRMQQDHSLPTSSLEASPNAVEVTQTWQVLIELAVNWARATPFILGS